MQQAPKSLLQLQVWLGRMIQTPIRKTGRLGLPLFDASQLGTIDAYITRGPFLSASERLGLLNQQFWFRMFVLMQERYPTVLRLFGYADFNYLLVEPFILKYFPDHWSLDLFGLKFPEWLEQEYFESDRDTILQAAQLDAAFDRSERQSAPFTFESNYDWIAFRQALLEHSPSYWQQRDFPELKIK